MRVLTLLAASIVVICAGCARTLELDFIPTPNDRAPGSIEKVERLDKSTALTWRVVLQFAPLPGPTPVDHGTTRYRVHYWTTMPDGSPTVATGLIALPKQGPLRGVVSYQHGTQSVRENVPSQKGRNEGLLGAAVFASAGYACVATDYIGLGGNTETHPYLHAESTVNASLDLLEAARTVGTELGWEWPENLLLAGFSQGGHATAVVQREIERSGIDHYTLVAAAAVSGPYDLAGISFPAALKGGSENHSLYLAYMVNGYCFAYDMPLRSVLRAPYDARVPELFNGQHDLEELRGAFPLDPREMFLPDFLDDYDNGRSTWLLDALAFNGALDWSPKAPLRIYFGEKDEDVVPEEAHNAYRVFSETGGNVSLRSVGPYDHEGGILQAIPLVRAWFDELAPKAGTAGRVARSEGYDATAAPSGKWIADCTAPSSATCSTHGMRWPPFAALTPRADCQ